MEMENILIGCDPELFVFDAERSSYISAHNMFPGTKEIPEVVPDGAIQVDGVAFEFNINPAKNSREFLTNISNVLQVGRGILEAQEHRSLMFHSTPVARFERQYFDSLPDYAKELGCDPDFNAYTGEENPRPATTEPFRTGSGHIHIGFGSGFDRTDPEHFALCRRLTAQMDSYLYFASLLWDTNTQRQALYGKPGSFRPKPYGVEYRVLSNAWLNKPELITFVYDATAAVTRCLLEDDVFFPRHKDVKERIDRARNGEKFSRAALVDYLLALSGPYDLPEVPYEIL